MQKIEDKSWIPCKHIHVNKELTGHYWQLLTNPISRTSFVQLALPYKFSSLHKLLCTITSPYVWQVIPISWCVSCPLMFCKQSP